MNLLLPVAELLIVETGKEAILKKLSENYSIGRSKDSDICLSSRKVSREAALLRRTAESYLSFSTDFTKVECHYQIVDLSRHGICLNGKKIQEYSFLKNGDLVELPDCHLKYFVLKPHLENPQSTSL